MRTGALFSVHENVVANYFSSGRDRRPGRFSIVIAVSFAVSIHGTANAAFFLSAAHAETGATKVSVPESIRYILAFHLLEIFTRILCRNKKVLLKQEGLACELLFSSSGFGHGACN
jgi:hypothetical protein